MRFTYRYRYSIYHYLDINGTASKSSSTLSFSNGTKVLSRLYLNLFPIHKKNNDINRFTINIPNM